MTQAGFRGEVVWTCGPESGSHRLASLVETARRHLAEAPPTSVLPFECGDSFRPVGSFRSYNVRLRGAGEHGVLTIKGSEPAAPDFTRLLKNLRRPSASIHSMADHLAWEEGKLPGALGLAEAQAEAAIAAEVQERHRAAYKGFARLPLPLLVLRHDPQVEARYRKWLVEALGPAAGEHLRDALAEGLGLYVYYYPAIPVRAREVAEILSGRDIRARLLALMNHADPDTLLNRWTGLFARLLCLGYLPGSASGRRNGMCCQPQNACIDGGFVDLESLTPLGRFADDGQVFDALAISFEALLDTVVSVLLDGCAEPWSEDRRLHDRRVVEQHLWARLRDALAAERQRGSAIDPRVAAWFEGTDSFAVTVDILIARRDPGDPGFSPAQPALRSAAAARLSEAGRALGDEDAFPEGDLGSFAEAGKQGR